MTANLLKTVSLSSSIFHGQGFRALNAEIFKAWQQNGYSNDEFAAFWNKSRQILRQNYSRHPQPAPTQQHYPYTPRGNQRQQPKHQGRESFANEQYSFPPPRGNTPDNHAELHKTPSAGRGRMSNPNSNVSMSVPQQKRFQQMEGLKEAEEKLRPISDQCPSDAKLRGKLLHLQYLKKQLEGEQDRVLNSSETSFLSGINKWIERRQAANASKEFERLAAEEIEAGGARNGGIRSAVAMNMNKRRVHEDATVHEEHNGPLFVPYASDPVQTENGAAASPYSPSYHPTTGGKTLSQDRTQERKRVRFAGGADGGYRGGFDDASEKEEDDEDEGEV